MDPHAHKPCATRLIVRWAMALTNHTGDENVFLHYVIIIIQFTRTHDGISGAAGIPCDAIKIASLI